MSETDNYLVAEGKGHVTEDEGSRNIVVLAHNRLSYVINC